ncbi:MAG: hypothetical protein COU22_03200 [Candidatus Komeilibacteria bacterium CG10_big_fil_rev_8_21_14_0_10_41_13]|uniref:SbsA Ig-like domain-containing protein n=1 Tax=Candidatus Komeilibacteria bacterium CG10_big_fil_rev_8_21_14_0_10_41_13 TaxID=1974476 RepID=A0A2M6WBT1_9BACT|nr:MAG: hypothetical protein COU22_03200 [Candidatus Komeilibacteria bacterium CG10_big_fil_rev_8_21_14_0_10_41_13]
MPRLNKNKKYLTVALAVVLFLTAAVFILPSLAQAQTQPDLGLNFAQETGLGTRDVRSIVANVIRILLGLLGIIAVAIVVYGGYLWMTSRGDEKQIETARKILINGAIGLVIIVAAYAIAQFVINRLAGSTFETEQNRGRRAGFEYSGGALGGGILRDVYPEPGSRDVPRNTLIMATFAELMDTGSIIETGNRPEPCQAVPEETVCGYLKEALGEPTTVITNRTTGDSLTADQVIAMTNNNRTYVFRPLQYLGSSDSYSDYVVNLTDRITKADDAPAFLSGGYTWLFEVSNLADLVPPRVESVEPVFTEGGVMMNTVIQINFNEPMNAITATGVATGDPDDQSNTLDHILITYGDGENLRYLSGQATISNGFTTVEFITDIACPMPEDRQVNSCGLVPKCLPVENDFEDFTVLLEAALVNGNIVDIFSGLTDAAGNSLDGGGQEGRAVDGNSQGQPDDNYWWTFRANNNLDLDPPQITGALTPEQDDNIVPRNIGIKATFNESLRRETVSSESFRVFESDCGLDNAEFPESLSCYPSGGFRISSQSRNNQTEVRLRTYSPYLDPLTNYNSRLTAEIQDLYQNCFNPDNPRVQ